MKKLILTVGCPGSGKSTWAQQYIKNNPGFFEVNRDNLRTTMNALNGRNEYKYTKAREKLVTDVQQDTVARLMMADSTKGVIVSDTNLNQETRWKWAQIATANNWDISYITIEQPWTELVKRNSYRGTSAVPIDVLRAMYKNMCEYMTAEKIAYVPNEELPKAVIFDLDGTLANNDHRSPYDLESLHNDKPKEMVVNLLKMLKENGYTIITVSGRESGTKDEPLRYKHSTIEWMMASGFGLQVSEHYQRQQGDSRKDDVVKEEIFRSKIAPNYNVKLAIDDRDQVVEMWRRIGVECWQVGFGNF
ncbi:3'-phosphatase, 5'-polynucleotide kinase [Yersinia phage vB_YenM_TG1]|uniref:3'-phosphatase, 5'-polynucleotide kinase n=1 Tax=Yersinia phage vB_YenM_TG1 TaxID=1589265 RepID=A0A0B5A2P8_9CAUD|nr:polynucleotide kinase [Yersinia phage vB_YenM_TG1]AJD82029.1 3'-phosphatase, 5'-polynucleotide kinase [Yersinia phage vB_YenM_TG1]